MPILPPTSSFDDVYRLETSDPVKGGPISGPVDSPTDGHANAQAQALTNRTKYLYDRLLPAGVIVPYGGVYPTPAGWIGCTGLSLNRADYPELFAAIGTAYGAPSATEFRVPDLRGRFLRGTDEFFGLANPAGRDPDAGSRTEMAAGGNTGNAVGSIQDDEFESHQHQIAIKFPGTAAGSNNAQGADAYDGTSGSGVTGGNETRPKNIYVNFIIWAGQ